MDDEKLVLAAIRREAKESARLEFKKTLNISAPENKAEFIRDVISLANSEGEIPRLAGYLIIGFKDGKTYDVRPDAHDGATLRQIVEAYISPEVPITYIEVYVNKRKTRIGAIKLIPDPTALYVVRKDLLGGDGRRLLSAGQTWGRKGDGKRSLTGDDIATRISAITDIKSKSIAQPLLLRISQLETVLRQSGPVAEVRRIKYAVELEYSWAGIVTEIPKLMPYIRDYGKLVVPEVLQIAHALAGRVSAATPSSAIRDIIGMLIELLPYEHPDEKFWPAKRTISSGEQDLLVSVCRIAAGLARDAAVRLRKADAVNYCSDILHLGLRFAHVNGLTGAFEALDALIADIEQSCAASDDVLIREQGKYFGSFREWERLSIDEQEKQQKRLEAKLKSKQSRVSGPNSRNI